MKPKTCDIIVQTYRHRHLIVALSVAALLYCYVMALILSGYHLPSSKHLDISPSVEPLSPLFTNFMSLNTLL